jgi:hypothetical protein
METAVDQLKKLRQKRHDDALLTYSKLLLRFDSPQAGDAETLDRAMCELKIDVRQLEADMHLILHYRQYQCDKPHVDSGAASRKDQKDADCIRRGNRRLFLALDQKNETSGQPHP